MKKEHLKVITKPEGCALQWGTSTWVITENGAL